MPHPLYILITGGAKGLGKHIAEYCLAQGASVVVFDRTPVEKLDSQYYKKLFHYTLLDLANIECLTKAFQELLQKTDNRLDVVINNAWPRSFQPFTDFSPADLQHFLNASLHATFLLTNLSLPLMRHQGFGRIIFLSSKSAFQGYSSGSLYCSTKMALLTFHESLSRELKNEKDIAILTLCPDSFANLNGHINKKGEYIIKSVCHRIFHFIKNGHSAIYYIGGLKNRLFLLTTLLKKQLYLLR